MTRIAVVPTVAQLFVEIVPFDAMAAHNLPHLRTVPVGVIAAWAVADKGLSISAARRLRTTMMMLLLALAQLLLAV